MRSMMLGIAVVIVAASPAMADGLPVAPHNGSEEAPIYEREYRTIPPRVVLAPRVVEVPVVTETVIIRRPLVVARPRVLVEEYPVYAAPRIYAYGGYPMWRRGPWGHRNHFYGRW